MVAPAVAVIVAELNRRPSWQVGQPFPVPAELYAAAFDEMTAIMKKRGFGTPISPQLNVPNFLIQGTPIISHG